MNGYGWVTLIVVFFVAVWVGSKWPTINVIGRVTG